MRRARLRWRRRNGWLRKPGVREAGFDPARTTVAELTRWKSELPSRLRKGFFQAVPAPFVEQLRMVKDEDELAVMAEAALKGCKLFEHILTLLRPGIAEIEVAAELEYQARKLALKECLLNRLWRRDCARRMPHGRATARALPRRGFVTLDFGIIHKGYCSDMTRTVFLGKPKPEERRTYEAVLEAQEDAVRRGSPGVSCAEVDEAARSAFCGGKVWLRHFPTPPATGWDLRFTSRRGLARDRQRGLLAGMVMTIEPGVYLAGKFGIRIEDMVAVTRNGGQVLTPAPKALIEL